MQHAMDSTALFFSTLYRDTDCHISYYPFLGRDPRKGKYEHLDKAIPTIYKTIDKYDYYFVVNPTGSIDRLDKATRRAFCFFIDIDNDKLPDHFALEPSAIISREDGKGHHIYWFFKDPLEFETPDERTKWTALQKKMIFYYKSDPAIHNAARIMRVPGTANFKEKLIKEHGRPLFYEVAKCDPIYYTIAEIIDAHSSHKAIKTEVNRRINNVFGNEKLRDGDGRHNKMTQAAFIMNDYGYNKKNIIRELVNLNEKKLADQYNYDKIKSIADAVEYAKNEAGATLVEREAAKYIQIEKMKRNLANWYFVETPFTFVDLDNIDNPLERPVFNARFSYTAERVDVANFVFLHNIVKRARQYVYEPGKSKVIEEGDEVCINMWQSSELTAKKPKNGKPAMFMKHMEYLFPNTFEREYILDFFAHMVQKPREKIRHALIIIGGQGTGKSILNIAMRHILGSHNVSLPSNENLSDRNTKWAKHAQLCWIDEVEQADKKGFMNKIKPYISEDYIEIREMYKDSYTIKNYMNFVATTNSVHPLLLAEDDRRFMIVESPAKPKDKDYYIKLVKYFEESANEILWLLQNRDIEKFYPGARPPLTDIKKEMIQNSKPELQALIEELMELKEGPFEVPLIAVQDIIDYFSGQRQKIYGISKQNITRVLKRIGARYMDTVIRINGFRRRFWICYDLEKWEKIIQDGGYNEEARKVFETRDDNIVEFKAK